MREQLCWALSLQTSPMVVVDESVDTTITLMLWDFPDTHVCTVIELQILSARKRMGKTRATAWLMLALLYIDRSC